MWLQSLLVEEPRAVIPIKIYRDKNRERRDYAFVLNCLPLNQANHVRKVKQIFNSQFLLNQIIICPKNGKLLGLFYSYYSCCLMLRWLKADCRLLLHN